EMWGLFGISPLLQPSGCWVQRSLGERLLWVPVCDTVPRDGSKVILDCDFTTNVTGNFTELFWLHEREESPPRLIAWHHESSCPDGNSTGNRFQSSLDLENHRSRLTISGLQESDSGWYQCERLGESSGRQRGRGTNLTVLVPQAAGGGRLWPPSGPVSGMSSSSGPLWLSLCRGVTEVTLCLQLLAFPGRSPSAGCQGQS
uniref:Ig-like domain-containing protein n=1 Tax=Apteryx owenii TaxID=8824 RepID=A0A8B9PV30_APTOW